MSKATPGPWELAAWVRGHGDKPVYRLIKTGKRNLAIVGVYGHDPRTGEVSGRKYRDQFGDVRTAPCSTEEQCDANARLIASAPDLLACCERALTQSARVHPDFLEQLHTALAKAKGQS